MGLTNKGFGGIVSDEGIRVSEIEVVWFRGIGILVENLGHEHKIDVISG